MKLIPLEQTPTGPLVREYRDISWRGLIYVGIAFLLAAAYTLLPKESGPSWGAALLPFLLAATFFILAAMRRMRTKYGWFLKSAPDGLYINTGYSDGYPIPGDTGAALFLAKEEVACLLDVMEVMRLPYRLGFTRHHFSCLDILIAGPIPETVVTHLQEQQERFKNADKSGPYPLRVTAPARLRLGWGWVQPGAKNTIFQLANQYRVTSPQNIIYPEWNALERQQQEIYIDELWRMGMISESLFLGRNHYNLPAAQIRRLLEDRNRPHL